VCTATSRRPPTRRSADRFGPIPAYRARRPAADSGPLARTAMRPGVFSAANSLHINSLSRTETQAGQQIIQRGGNSRISVSNVARSAAAIKPAQRRLATIARPSLEACWCWHGTAALLAGRRPARERSSVARLKGGQQPWTMQSRAGTTGNIPADLPEPEPDQP